MAQSVLLALHSCLQETLQVMINFQYLEIERFKGCAILDGYRIQMLLASYSVYQDSNDEPASSPFALIGRTRHCSATLTILSYKMNAKGKPYTLPESSKVLIRFPSCEG